MDHSRKIIGLLFLSAILLCSCTKTPPEPAKKSGDNLKTDAGTQDGTTENTDVAKAYRDAQVSAYTLDDSKFTVGKFAVGLKDYLDSQSPFLSYEFPKDSDYVEIIRCEQGVAISSGINTVPLKEMELSNKSEAELDAYFRSSNIFEEATNIKSCELLTQGSHESDFVDSFAPSGSFIWLIRACVSPERLLFKEKLSARNCSKRVTISSTLQDYTSKRSEKEKEALRHVSYYSSLMDRNAASIRAVALDFNQSLDECEKKEHRRAVSVAKKDAVIKLVAAGIEIAIGMKNWQRKQLANGKKMGYLQHARTNKMDGFQILVDMAGFITGPILTNLFTMSSDMPRSCTITDRLERNLKDLAQTLMENSVEHGYWLQTVELRELASEVTDGRSVTIPQPAQNPQQGQGAQEQEATISEAAPAADTKKTDDSKNAAAPTEGKK